MELKDITAEIEKNPELKTGLIGALRPDFQKVLESDGITIRTKDEEASFLKSHVEQVLPGEVSKVIGQKVKEVHDQYDEDLYKLLGKKKDPNQKTYDFMKAELEALKNVKGEPDALAKQRINELEGLLTQEKEKNQTELTTIHSNYFKNEVSMLVGSTLNGKSIAMPAHLKTDDEKLTFGNQQRAMIQQEFLRTYTAKKDNDGNVVFYEGEKAMLSTKDGKPLTADELMTAKFSQWFVAAPAHRAGTGTDPKNVEGHPVGGFKTKAEVDTYLIDEKKLARGSREWMEERTKLIAQYAITE